MRLRQCKADNKKKKKKKKTIPAAAKWLNAQLVAHVMLFCWSGCWLPVCWPLDRCVNWGLRRWRSWKVLRAALTQVSPPITVNKIITQSVCRNHSKRFNQVLLNYSLLSEWNKIDQNLSKLWAGHVWFSPPSLSDRSPSVLVYCGFWYTLD